MRQADAKAHSVAINPADLLKTRATGEGQAWAAAAAEEAAAAGAVAGAVVGVAAEVAEEAVAVVAEAAAGDDASW